MLSRVLIAAVLAGVLLTGAGLASAAAQDNSGPQITQVNIATAPQRGDTYVAGNEISVVVWYDEDLLITGSPGLNLQVGSETRAMSYDRCIGCGGVIALSFSYTVQASDRDSDGVAVTPQNITLDNGATVTDLAGNDAALDLTGHALSDDPHHKVDGSINYRPLVSDLRIDSTPRHDSTYAAGEKIDIFVFFDEEIVISGFPQLALQIGERTRFAHFDEDWGRDGGFVAFEYEVQVSEYDADGISIAADAMDLPTGSSISDRTGVDADLSLAAHVVADDPRHKVNGGSPADQDPAMVSSVNITSRPQRGDTYAAGNRISVNVIFSEKVTLEWTSAGAPRMTLALRIGADTRYAATVGCIGMRASGARCEGPVDGVTFVYDVQATDRDTDGLSIGADAIQLNGTRVRGRDGDDAALSLAGNTVVNDTAHRVDGGLDHPLSITSLLLLSQPRNGDAYGIHEEVLVAIYLDENVAVNGGPTLSLEIGADTRDASIATDLFDKAVIYFRYYVQATDEDADGISIGPDALRLNGGSIRDAAGNDIPTDLRQFAIKDDPDHKVNGRSERLPMIDELVIFSRPQRGDTYGPGETIEIRIGFSDTVRISPPAPETPPFEIALEIGSSERLIPGTTSFEYQVVASDYDSDGISIPEDALRVVRGTIVEDSRGREITDISLQGLAITNNPRHKVDGSPSEPVPLLPSMGVIILAMLLVHVGNRRLAGRTQARPGRRTSLS